MLFNKVRRLSSCSKTYLQILHFPEPEPYYVGEIRAACQTPEREIPPLVKALARIKDGVCLWLAKHMDEYYKPETPAAKAPLPRNKSMLVMRNGRWIDREVARITTA